MSALERPSSRPIPPSRTDRILAAHLALPLSQPRVLAISEAKSLGLFSFANLLDAGLEPANEPSSVRRSHTLSALDLSSASVLDEARTPLPMGTLEAFGHMVKGNLGAGCLALPLAFAMAGVRTALALFAIVALQGTYSMLVLARLKGALCAQGIRAHTFEDVGGVAFGGAGRRLIETLVVTLQLGICCIYISLLRTNLAAGLGGSLSERVALASVYALCALLSLLRNMSALWPLSTAANALMLCACVTAVVVSCSELARAGGAPPSAAPAASVATVARCFSLLFFAYEGIALVLPVENALNPLGEAPADPTDRGAGAAEARTQVARRSRRFERILLAAMAVITLVFVAVGYAVALAFPHIESGSVTAFLAARSPDDRWLGAVNAFVSLAVLLTYPLQMQPAVMVLDRLYLEGKRPSALQFTLSRVLLTTSCAAVVLAVPALDLLISLLGALCQTNLAALPFAIALRLHQLGLAPLSPGIVALHVVLVALCLLVCGTGTYFAVADIAAYLGGSGRASA